MSHEQSALVPANYNSLSRSARRTKDSTFDRIYKYYTVAKTRIELTDEEDKIRDRWEKAWFLLTSHKTVKHVVARLRKIYGIGHNTAYDDVKKSMQIFGNPIDDVKEAKRSIAETMALRGLEKCFADGDMEGYYKFLKAYQEINRLDQDQTVDMASVLKKLKPHQVIIVANNDDLASEAEKLQQELSKDVDHEVIE